MSWLSVVVRPGLICSVLSLAHRKTSAARAPAVAGHEASAEMQTTAEAAANALLEGIRITIFPEFRGARPNPEPGGRFCH
jgi:hypothetical protein